MLQELRKEFSMKHGII